MTKNIGLVNNYIIYPITQLLLDPLEKLKFSPITILAVSLILRLACLYLLFNKIKINNVIVIYILSCILLSAYIPISKKLNKKYILNYDILLDVITHILLFGLLLYNFNSIYVLLFLSLIGIIQLLIMLKYKCNNIKSYWYDNEISRKIYSFLKGINVDCKYKYFYNNFGSGFTYLLTVIFILLQYKKN